MPQNEIHVFQRIKLPTISDFCTIYMMAGHTKVAIACNVQTPRTLKCNVTLVTLNSAKILSPVRSP